MFYSNCVCWWIEQVWLRLLMAYVALTWELRVFRNRSSYACDNLIRHTIIQFNCPENWNLPYLHNDPKKLTKKKINKSNENIWCRASWSGTLTVVLDGLQSQVSIMFKSTTGSVTNSFTDSHLRFNHILIRW